MQARTPTTRSSRERPGFGTHLLLAALFGLLCIWNLASDSVGPGIGFGVVAVSWLVVGFIRRHRPSSGNRDTTR